MRRGAALIGSSFFIMMVKLIVVHSLGFNSIKDIL